VRSVKGIVNAQLHRQPLAVAARRCGPLASKPSFRYRWDNLDFRTCRRLGVIARRAPDGTPRFNFPQTVWLCPDIRMDWSVRLTPAVRTLAVNILTLWIPERDFDASFGSTTRRAVAAAAPFAQAFLLMMPGNGGFLPRDLIKEWIREEL
jgi:hypothetical protein